MTYIDANTIIFAACERGPVGNAAREVIKKIQGGELMAVTSALTYDEVVWGVRKLLSKEMSYYAGELFLALSHLVIKDVTRETISEAHHLMQHYPLKPRDAIHVATMCLEGETEIISEDPDFDCIPIIKRITLSP